MSEAVVPSPTQVPDIDRSTNHEAPNPTLRTTWKQRIGSWVAAGACVVGALWLAMPGQSGAATGLTNAPAQPMAVVKVEAARVVTGSVVHSYSGIVRAEHESVLSFVGGGRLLQRTVEAGDHVQAGQVIARNDAEPIRNAHKTLRAQAQSLTTQRDQLTRDVTRVDQLRAQGAASVQQQEQLRSQLAMVGASLVATEAQLQDAQRQLDESVLRAPFDGVVTETLVHVGEVLAPGQPVVRLAAPGGTDVEVRVPESLVTSLRTDTPIEVRFPLSSAEVKSAAIAAIATSAVTGQALYPVRVGLIDATNVRSGMTAEVSFHIRTGSRVLVPADAIVAPTGRGSWVLALDHTDRIRSIPVTLEGASDDGIVVQGNLRDGERIVVGAPAGLVAGTQVAVAP